MRSGVKPTEAQETFGDRYFNKQQITPNIARNIQAAQYQHDWLPQVNREWDNYAAYKERRGETASRSDQGWISRKNTLAKRWGYNNYLDLEQQYQPMTDTSMRDTYSAAGEAAKHRQEHSHMGRGNWIERIVDRAHKADSTTGITDLALAGAGSVPAEEVSPGLKAKYPISTATAPPTPPASGIEYILIVYAGRHDVEGSIDNRNSRAGWILS